MDHMEAKMQSRYDAADDEARLRQEIGARCEVCCGTGEIIRGRPGEPWDDWRDRCDACDGFGTVHVAEATVTNKDADDQQ